MAVVVGGGIGGLAAAVALHRRGLDDHSGDVVVSPRDHWLLPASYRHNHQLIQLLR